MKYRMWVIVLLMVQMVAVNHGAAQEFRCTQLPNQAQLPVPQIGLVLQDQTGFMWYGTQDGGVCRDDGYHVLTFNSSQRNCKEIENDEVTALAEDPIRKRIWVGTRSGLYYIDQHTLSVHAIPLEEARHKKIHCMAVRKDGCLWFGVERKIVLLSPELTVLKSFSIGDNPREEPKSMMIDHEGTLWVCILRGGLRTIAKDCKKLENKPWTLDAAAHYIVEDTLHQCYWVGTWDRGVVSYPDMNLHPATLHTEDTTLFSSKVNNMVIDYAHQLLWTSTACNLFAYRIVSVFGTDNRRINTLLPMDTAPFMPEEKKIIGNLYLDRYNHVWVPGSMPHTFIISSIGGWGDIRRDPVPAMEKQIGYKLMVSRMVREGNLYWIYQDRTRLSLYDCNTGKLTFMATEAQPKPQSTNRALCRRRGTKGVWTCSGHRLLHVWNQDGAIHWEELTNVHLPNYISALNDVGNGQLLIGTEKQVFLYNYQKQTLTALTDSVGVVNSVGYDSEGKLQYTLHAGQLLPITDPFGHVWQLTETRLTETNPRTGATRTIRPNDPDVQMEHFTDFSLTGDSICLGGIGAVCFIGHSPALDKPQYRQDTIVLTDGTHLSTLNPLYASTTRFAYRSPHTQEWTYLEPGNNTIDPGTLPRNIRAIEVMATDPFGRWSQPQVLPFVHPHGGRFGHWLWMLLIPVLAIGWWWWKRRKKTDSSPADPSLTLPSMGGDAIQTASPHREGDTPQGEKGSGEVLPPLLLQVSELVQKNLDNPAYGIENLCADMAVSRMNLYRKFQAATQQTPSEYIRSIRLKQAVELLRNTEQSVSEVAYAVGFTSPQYFIKCFKEEFGETPKKFRQQKTVPQK
ncbi:MAG: helix-turn-helix domain-containing protein [Bacteroidaceae bacterium]|nr:helix-turn-helix domain-containing protein [Bacteroidaceae bacterium]